MCVYFLKLYTGFDCPQHLFVQKDKIIIFIFDNVRIPVCLHNVWEFGKEYRGKITADYPAFIRIT